jgi:hypothetical protein
MFNSTYFESNFCSWAVSTPLKAGVFMVHVGGKLVCRRSPLYTWYNVLGIVGSFLGV